MPSRMTEEEYNELVSLVKAEVARRSGRDIDGKWLGYSTLNGLIMDEWNNNAFIPSINVKNDKSMLAEQASIIVNKLLTIFDLTKGSINMGIQQPGGNTNSLFNYTDIKLFISTLSKESYTTKKSSCRSACPA